MVKAASKKTSPQKKASKTPPKKTMVKKGRGSGKKAAPKTKQGFRLGRMLWRLFLYGFLLAFLLGGGLVLYLSRDMPNINEAFAVQRSATITITDANGQQIYRQGADWGRPLTIEELPEAMADALIAVEDKRFYYHLGIDPYAILRAVYRNMRFGTHQGGSTITQQLAKNMFLKPDKTLKRKSQEALLALWLEWKFSKEQILTMYLNRVYFGSSAWTVDGASQLYFNHSATELSVWEAAMLAGIMKNPNGYNPHSNKKRAEQRTRLVLKLMYDQNKISQQEYEQALKEGENKQYPKKQVNRSWYVDWILGQSQSFIKAAKDDIIIETTFDGQAQEKAQSILNSYLASEGAAKNVSQGAILSMSVDGAVIAMVGGRDYKKSQFNRATQAKRQPGSSLKPLIWQLALEKGQTLNDYITDKPINIKGWKPQNYDRKYRGQVTLQQALRSSLNTVAVQLAQWVGNQNIIDAAYRQGITTPLDAVDAIALGTEEVTLQDMVSLYGSWASGGYQVFPWGIKRITDSKGNVLYAHSQTAFAQMVSTPVVAQMNLALSDVILNGTAKNAQLPFDVAGKTGTTQDYRDAWFLGYSSQIVTGVWLGNDDNSLTHKLSGGTLPAKIWHDYMAYAHENLTPPDLPKPSNTYILDDNSPTRELILW